MPLRNSDRLTVPTTFTLPTPIVNRLTGLAQEAGISRSALLARLLGELFKDDPGPDRMLPLRPAVTAPRSAAPVPGARHITEFLLRSERGPFRFGRSRCSCGWSTPKGQVMTEASAKARAGQHVRMQKRVT